jgi:hypothetical protein
MSTTKKLRLGPLPKTESIKLTFACPAGLKADLGPAMRCCTRRPTAKRSMQRR